MVRTHERRAEGGQVSKGEPNWFGKSELDVGNKFLPFLFDAGFQNVRAVTVSAEDGSGKLMTHTWKTGNFCVDKDEVDIDRVPRLGDEAYQERSASSTTVDEDHDGAQGLLLARTGIGASTAADVDPDAGQDTAFVRSSRTQVTSSSRTKRGRPSRLRQDQYVDPITTYIHTNPKTESDNDEPNIRPTSRMQGFHISDEPKVTAFLHERLVRIQQLADKRIAKAWIKGICPKKQAMYPYQNKQRKEGNGQAPVVPIWWPSTKLCPFTEPDHIRKHERTALMLHLLRLRPAPEELKAWNQNKIEPLHIYGEWTRFLKDLTPESIFDDMKPESDEKAKRRWKYLMEVFEVAEMEEQYKSFGMGGEQLYQWQDEEPRSAAGKRSRRAKSIMSSVGHDADMESRSSSTTREITSSKRHRQQSSDRASVADGKLAIHMSNFAITEKPVTEPESARRPSEPDFGKIVMSRSTSQVGRGNVGASDEKFMPHSNHSAVLEDGYHRSWPTEDQRYAAQDHRIASCRPLVVKKQQPPVAWPSCEITPATSFDRPASDQVSVFDPYQVQTSFSMLPGRQDYDFPSFNNEGQHTVQVRQVAQMTQPHFDTVPNTPVYSPVMLGHSQGFDPMAGTMAITPGTISAQAYPFIGAFEDQQMVHPAPQPQLHHGLPMSYPSQGRPTQHQGATIDYQDQYDDTPWDGALWTWRDFPGHNSAV